MKITIDATNQSLGRLASHIAVVLRGKHLPSYEPHILPKIEVLIKNIDKIKFLGTKMKGKRYHHYSGYPGGLKTRKLADLWEKKPGFVVRQSVYRMLPKNKLRSKIIRNLKFE